MKSISFLSSTALLCLAIGCGDSDPGNTNNETTNINPDPSGDNPTTDESEATTTTEGESQSTTSTTSTTFIAELDGVATETCDPWAQDCDAGEKCVAYRSPGGTTWDANRCVPVVESPKTIGDECTEMGSAQSGEDDCDATSTCNWVKEGKGICVGFCTGTRMNPSCPDPSTSCNIDNDGTRILCNPKCDPVSGDCPDNTRQTCLYAPASDTFNCELGWGDGGLDVGEACHFDNSCTNGNLCWYEPSSLPNCEEDACCTPYCDLDNPTCPGDGTQCLPFFDEGSEPPGLDHIGVCLLPT